MAPCRHVYRLTGFTAASIKSSRNNKQNFIRNKIQYCVILNYKITKTTFGYVHCKFGNEKCTKQTMCPLRWRNPADVNLHELTIRKYTNENIYKTFNARANEKHIVK